MHLSLFEPENHSFYACYDLVHEKKYHRIAFN